MNQQVTIIDSLLVKLKEPFVTQNAYSLKFESECLFAKQQITKSDFNLKTAQNNPISLRNAILNVAAIGISLNPANAHAYLVPRDGGICLDISYRGLVKLATDCGAVKDCKTELVYQEEAASFIWNGPYEMPTHPANPFSKDRGEVVGAYNIAFLPDGRVMVDTMSREELEKVRSSSKAQNGPWKNWPLEMMKKTMTKRASKSWPQTENLGRMNKAVEVLNEHEGLLEEKAVGVADYLLPSPDQTQTYLELAKGEPVTFWLWYRDLDQRIQASLPNCEFEKGKKQVTMKGFNDKLVDGQKTFDDWSFQLREMCEQDDDSGAGEFLQELSASQAIALVQSLPPQNVVFATKAMEQAA